MADERRHYGVDPGIEGGDHSVFVCGPECGHHVDGQHWSSESPAGRVTVPEYEASGDGPNFGVQYRDVEPEPVPDRVWGERFGTVRLFTWALDLGLILGTDKDAGPTHEIKVEMTEAMPTAAYSPEHIATVISQRITDAIMAELRK